MIGPDYARMMARYNAWQNQWMFQACDGLSDAQRTEDRGLFWGSIQCTLSHLLWGDHTWIARFDGGEAPRPLLNKSAAAYDWATLMAERPKMDARIAAWAWNAASDEFGALFRWTSPSTGQSFEKPFDLCVIQLFNHQTHHRGQVHAALTALGEKTDDTDLPFMPDEVPEWG